MADMSSSRDAALAAAAHQRSQRRGYGGAGHQRRLDNFADFFIISTHAARRTSPSAPQLTAFSPRTTSFCPEPAQRKGGERVAAAGLRGLVIHLKEKEQRAFYDLERLWFKAERVTY